MAPAGGFQYDINLSILFTELDLLERPAAAKAAGFDAVEFWWPWVTEPVPSDAEVDAFVRAIDEAGVQLVGLNFFAGELPGPDRGVLSDPSRAKLFRDNIDAATAIGERLGCRAFNALYGLRMDGVDADKQDDIAAESLALAAKGVQRVGGTVLLEPVSGSDAYPLQIAADAIAVMDRVQRESGQSNLGLLNDLYHLRMNGDDLDAVIANYTDRTAHVQIADAPGRNEPGTGELDFDKHFTALAANGYTGYIGLEYKPSGATTDSFAWMR